MTHKILLADDSVTIQKVVELTFADSKYIVTSVGDGLSALRKAKELKPDVILLDIFMPELDGYQVCERVKNDPQLKHTPVLLLAGTFESFDEDRARQVLANGYLTKPFESTELISRIEEQIRKAEEQFAAIETQAVSESMYREETPDELEAGFVSAKDEEDVEDLFEEPVFDEAQAAEEPVFDSTDEVSDFLAEPIFEEAMDFDVDERENTSKTSAQSDEVPMFDIDEPAGAFEEAESSDPIFTSASEKALDEADESDIFGDVDEDLDLSKTDTEEEDLLWETADSQKNAIVEDENAFEEPVASAQFDIEKETEEDPFAEFDDEPVSEPADAGETTPESLEWPDSDADLAEPEVPTFGIDDLREADKTSETFTFDDEPAKLSDPLDTDAGHSDSSEKPLSMAIADDVADDRSQKSESLEELASSFGLDDDDDKPASPEKFSFEKELLTPLASFREEEDRLFETSKESSGISFSFDDQKDSIVTEAQTDEFLEATDNDFESALEDEREAVEISEDDLAAQFSDEEEVEPLFGAGELEEAALIAGEMQDEDTALSSDDEDEDEELSAEAVDGLSFDAEQLDEEALIAGDVQDEDEGAVFDSEDDELTADEVEPLFGEGPEEIETREEAEVADLSAGEVEEPLFGEEEHTAEDVHTAEDEIDAEAPLQGHADTIDESIDSTEPSHFAEVAKEVDSDGTYIEEKEFDSEDITEPIGEEPIEYETEGERFEDITPTQEADSIEPPSGLADEIFASDEEPVSADEAVTPLVSHDIDAVADVPDEEELPAFDREETERETPVTEMVTPTPIPDDVPRAPRLMTAVSPELPTIGKEDLEQMLRKKLDETFAIDVDTMAEKIIETTSEQLVTALMGHLADRIEQKIVSTLVDRLSETLADRIAHNVTESLVANLQKTLPESLSGTISGDLTQQLSQQLLTTLELKSLPEKARVFLEDIAWEVVPDLAESIIRREIDLIKAQL